MVGFIVGLDVGTTNQAVATKYKYQIGKEYFLLVMNHSPFVITRFVAVTGIRLFCRKFFIVDKS